MEHPCLGCVNNWSGDTVGCSDFCNQLEEWKRLTNKIKQEQSSFEQNSGQSVLSAGYRNVSDEA